MALCYGYLPEANNIETSKALCWGFLPEVNKIETLHGYIKGIGGVVGGGYGFLIGVDNFLKKLNWNLKN